MIKQTSKFKIKFKPSFLLTQKKIVETLNVYIKRRFPK